VINGERRESSLIQLSGSLEGRKRRPKDGLIRFCVGTRIKGKVVCFLPRGREQGRMSLSAVSKKGGGGNSKTLIDTEQLAMETKKQGR